MPAPWTTDLRCPRCSNRDKTAFLAMQCSVWPTEKYCSYFKLRCRTCGLVLEGKGFADSDYEGKWQDWLIAGAKRSGQKSTSIGKRLYGGGGMAQRSARRTSG